MKFKYLEDNHKYLISQHKSRRYSNVDDERDICLGCADTDVKVASFIRDHIKEIIDTGDLSYVYLTYDFYETVQKWFKETYNLTFEEKNFVNATGVIHLIQIFLETHCHVGEKVIVDIPAYPPFLSVVEGKGIKVNKNRLVYDKETGNYSYDFDKFEKMCKDPLTTAYLFCNPHNPTGIVWTREQMERIIRICKENDVYIISDEIWGEIIFNNEKHLPIIKVDPTMKNIFSLHSIAKIFNAGACSIGYGFSYNEKIISLIKKTLESSIHYSSTNYLGYHLVYAGFTHPEMRNWVKEYNEFLCHNKSKFKREIEAHTDIVVTPSNATSVSWFNYAKLNISPEEFEARLTKNHISGVHGYEFGAHREEKFFRFVLGIFPELLDDLISRMIKEFGPKTQ